MGVFSSVRSQWNNVRCFRSLFPLHRLAFHQATLVRDLWRGDGWASPPLVVNLLLTSRCNLNCAMCSVQDFRKRRYQELTVQEIGDLARQGREIGATFYMGGGEPFVRTDLLDLVAAVKSYGRPLGMVTNGLGLRPEAGRELHRLGLDHLMVSLHGPEEVHDRIVGVPGSFRKVSENIRDFCAIPGRRTTVVLNFVLSRDNIESLPRFVAMGKALGVDRVRVEHLLYLTDEDIRRHDAWCETHLPSHLKDRFHASSFLCQADIVNGMAERLPAVLDRVKRDHGDFVILKPYLGPRDFRRWYGGEGLGAGRPCLFVWRALFVEPDGSVIPCQHYGQMVMGNVREQSLLEIWNRPEYREMRRVVRHGDLPACTRCCKI